MFGLNFISHKDRRWTILQSLALGALGVAEGLVVILTVGYCWPDWSMNLMVRFLKAGFKERRGTE